MNKDQVAGSVKEAAGKVQRKVGEALGDKKQQAKGTENQAAGKTQKTVGNVKDTFNK
ncbi:CsbD family protein [Noviherbaspirillum galbum]|uniref:CsbD family protein n=1 Tax=Noviherbaspirillum galbum TaxID=2709383 RepID=A0A6B3SP83_9BURK|nr:CsbD family protein [Noviherbaspirillum galbum]NEX59529.1 CsbD family protein [Noviherbaspirillum galbum]